MRSMTATIDFISFWKNSEWFSLSSVPNCACLNLRRMSLRMAKIVKEAISV
jgi:hypothetical protein